MAKIKFIGIIKGDISDYQRGRLPQDAVKLNMPATAKVLIKALPFAIPAFIIIFLSMFLKTYFAKEVIIDPLYFAIGVIASFLALPLHELLHAAVYPKGATVYIGFSRKPFAAMALCSCPVKKMRFIVMCLLPYILGIIPITLFICFPYSWKIVNSVMFGLSIMGLISPYPDAYNVFQVIKQTPRNCYLQFFEDELYCF